MIVGGRGVYKAACHTKEHLVGIGYANEKFSQAVRDMATSPKSIQRRIADVLSEHIGPLQPADLPVEVSGVASELAKYRAAWMEQPGETGRIGSWADQLSTKEAVEVADWIVRAQAKIEIVVEEMDWGSNDPLT
jgi:hypothetical protein